MKKSYISLIIYSLCFDIYSLDRIYQDLKNNAGFRGLSSLEIAIDRNDLEAIKHFSITADTTSLIRSIADLKAQIDFAYQELGQLDKMTIYYRGEVALAQKKAAVFDRITKLNTIIESLRFALQQR